MTLYRIFTLFLCFNMAFPLKAQTVDNSQGIHTLLLEHQSMVTGVGSMELINKHGKDLADATARILKDAKNKNFLNTPEGMELKSRQQLLLNYLVIKERLEKCARDNPGDKRNLRDRILQASLQNMGTAPCPVSNLDVNKSFTEFNNDVMKATKKMVRPYFQNQLSTQVMTNTAKSLLSFRKKFTPGFMEAGVLSDKEVRDLVATVCEKKNVIKRGSTEVIDVCQKMDTGFRSTLTQTLREYAPTQSGKKFSAESATDSLNGAIDRINGTLGKIELKTAKGYIYDSADLTGPMTKSAFDQYVSQYAQEVSKDAGTLLLTSSIKEGAGAMKSLDNDDVTKNKSHRFQLSLHQKVRVKDVRASIKEAEGKILDQAQDTLDIAISSDDDVNELVKINPFAAGQVLIHNPESVEFMCQAISSVNLDDVSKRKRDDYFMVGTAVLGGALALTGAGTMLGAYLITGSLMGGAVAGTIGGSIMGYTTLAGGVIEATSLVYRSKRGYDEYMEMNRLESAFLTQNGDKEGLIDAKNALIEFKEARMMAVISLSGIGMDAGIASRIFSLFRSGAKVTPVEVRAATKVFQYLEQTMVGNRLRDITNLMGANAWEKMDEFLLNLIHVSEANRLKFLEFLKDKTITPEKLKDVIQTSLEAAKKCA